MVNLHRRWLLIFLEAEIVKAASNISDVLGEAFARLLVLPHLTLDILHGSAVRLSFQEQLFGGALTCIKFRCLELM